ncbi:MAG: hypothetical protein IPM42_00860 [Saprospiraceae bacterium]|nr:hypothetical protein [Saprospiraceae bacterium]
MDDRILELTEKIYQEGVIKAKDQASDILLEAQLKASEILLDAEKQAEKIIQAASQESSELTKNIHEEIKHASRQAINTVKQKITELITYKITEQPLRDILDDKLYIAEIISQMVNHWKKTNNNEKFDLVLPSSMQRDTENILIKTILEQFGQNVEINFSQKIQSGFRISPIGKNYIISFTEQDFTSFFNQFLRPKTIRILYNDNDTK